MKIVATIPAGLEDHRTVAGAVASAVHAGIRAIPYDGPPRAELTSEAELRRIGLELARAEGADWWLQLDADERLRNASHLYELLERCESWAYPIPYVHEAPPSRPSDPDRDELDALEGEDGWVTLAPFKLVRAREVELVAHSDYFDHEGRCYRLSGYPMPRELWSLVGAGPHLLHAPSLRPGGNFPRLSDVELGLEPRPTDALEFPIPENFHHPKGEQMGNQPPDERGEWEAGDGAYYCPGCGARYDTAGTCEGTTESPHEPTAVEKVSGGNGGDGWPTSHAGLDELAKTAGLEDWHEGKGGPTVAEKTEALKAAGVSPSE